MLFTRTWCSFELVPGHWIVWSPVEALCLECTALSIDVAAVCNKACGRFRTCEDHQLGPPHEREMHLKLKDCKGLYLYNDTIGATSSCSQWILKAQSLVWACLGHGIRAGCGSPHQRPDVL